MPVHPSLSTDMSEWPRQFLNDWKTDGTLTTTNFGTLRNLVYRDQRTNTDPALKRLCLAVHSTQEEQELLLAAYTLLAKTIRNRDAHAYVPNVRDDHFSLVPDLFAGCFNLLVSWLPDGPGTLNNWRDDAQDFITWL